MAVEIVTKQNLSDHFDLGNIEAGKIRPISDCQAKWYNTNNTTNLNTNTSTAYVVDMPIFGVEDTDISNNCFTRDSETQITCTVAGVYEIKTNFHWFGGTRVNVLTRCKRNNTTVGEASGFYTRNTSGHNECSSNICATLSLSVGDNLKIGCRREAGTGTGRLALPNTSSIYIKRIK